MSRENRSIGRRAKIKFTMGNVRAMGEKNGIGIFLIKVAHTLIFFGMSGAIGVIWWAALTNRVTRWTKLALASIAAEGVVLVANGWVCPLRTWAEQLGAERGSVTDIFLPRWLADRIFVLCTPIMAVGALLLGARRLYAARRSLRSR